MWVFIWLVLSAILIGATVWSLNILLKQKKAWESFAAVKKLTFNRGTFMGPAEVSGMLGDYKLSFFTAQRAGPDARSKRYVSVIELTLAEGIFDGGAVGTKDMIPFMQSLTRLHAYAPGHAAWGDAIAAYVKDDAVMAAYLTPERAEALAQILKTKNADIIVIFNDREIVVRTETSDPMTNAEKIDKITKRLMALCNRLRVPADERQYYANMAAANVAAQAQVAPVADVVAGEAAPTAPTTP